MPLKQTPEKLEIGVRYSGGMDFRTVLEKSLNPRTVLDLRNGKTARGVIGRKEQLHVGREVRDDQNRILSNMTWKGANDLSASFELKKNGGRIEFVLNVTDDKVIPTPPGKQPYMYDSLELFVSPDLKKANRNIQTVIDAAGKVVVYSKESLKNFRSKAERTPKGYRITGSFDRPAGKSVGIDFSLNDCDDLRVPRKSAAAFTGNGFNPSSSQGYSILLTE